AILLGMVVSWSLGGLLTEWGDAASLKLGAWGFVWLLVLLPTALGGIAEDVTQRLAVRYRLGLTMVSGVLALALLGLDVPRTGLPWLDPWLPMVPWLSGFLVVLAVAGLPHAFNIIDGYNGLAGMVALIVCLALAHVALQVGDRALAALLVTTAAATGGFLLWNYPRGMLFAGDGGASIWGVVIALASLALVQRNAAVSPWFPMLLLIYPVWETVFSSYRKWVRGVSPGVADALHFHQLIYRRIVRSVFHDDESRRMLMRNNRTSPYLWGFTLLTVVPAVLFWNNTWVLMAFCALFVVTYVAAYLAIVRFKVPSWLRH
ncbi:MAG: MraY family glycosyltransferase, partial [Giesbergeria sp.]